MRLPIVLACLGDEGIYRAAARHGLTIDHESQLDFLRSTETVDLHAAPGSGKTTLAGLKLCLLASGWQSDRQGVCVLSHTNVAKDQIIEILHRDPDGARFLRYPHFVGTIQAFVDQFLALPYLRSRGIQIRGVDDEHYAAQAEKALSEGQFSVLRGFAARKAKTVPGLIRTAHYECRDGLLRVVGEASGKPADFPTAPSTASHEQFVRLKCQMAKRGIFRYADMYAFAAQYLHDHPDINTAVKMRFPYVLIDEMQDTSREQLKFISAILSPAAAIVQRVGDVNQRIYHQPDDEPEDATFPSANPITLSASLRFGQPIADPASKLTLDSPIQIIGMHQDGLPKPILLLFDENTISQVIHKFGEIVLATVPQGELQRFPVKAVGSRKQSDAKQLPRCIQCYAAHFSTRLSRQSKPQSLIAAVVMSRATSVSPREKPAVLWAACCDILNRWECTVDGFNPTPRRTRFALLRLDPNVHHAVRKALLGLSRVDVGSAQDWSAAVKTLLDALKVAFQLGNPSKSVMEYCQHQRALAPSQMQSAPTNEVEVQASGQRVVILLDTIHGVKGETHAATLVLECVNRGGIHDLKEVLPIIVDRHDDKRLLKTKTIAREVRHIYVAMTRPRHLVAFAVRKDHVDQLLGAFAANGWSVIDLTTGPTA